MHVACLVWYVEYSTRFFCAICFFCLLLPYSRVFFRTSLIQTASCSDYFMTF